MDELTVTQSALNQIINLIKGVSKQVTALRVDISGVKADTSGVKADISSLKADILHLTNLCVIIGENLGIAGPAVDVTIVPSVPSDNSATIPVTGKDK